MARSIIGGMLGKGVPGHHICASDPSDDCLKEAELLGPIHCMQDNASAVSNAEIIVLAVKPQVMGSVVSELAPVIAERCPVIISIAAGITVASIQEWLGHAAPVVRCMPNTPALLGAGATALFASTAVTAVQQSNAEDIMSAIGITRWVETELLLDAVTALSGSGPAYFFLLIEAMAEAGEKLGLDADLSRELSIATARGAALMAAEGDVPVAELRRRVTSPGGTTAAALAAFSDGGFEDLVDTAMSAAHQRAAELAQEMG
jgi:pyrroline-5-carboxylate reductase